MTTDQLLKNNDAWAAGITSKQPEYFDELAKGQEPKLLYIGCSDSRVAAEQLLGLEPGEVFVHRNIANLVPNGDLSAAGVIEYAVEYLKVDHIMVCGHHECGGVKAAMGDSDLGILNPWLLNIRDVYRTHQPELAAIADDRARYRRLVELNVVEQCFNVAKTSVVQRAVRERGVEIHGFVFDIATGRLQDLEVDLGGLFEKEQSLFDVLGA